MPSVHNFLPINFSWLSNFLFCLFVVAFSKSLPYAPLVYWDDFVSPKQSPRIKAKAGVQNGENTPFNSTKLGLNVGYARVCNLS